MPTSFAEMPPLTDPNGTPIVGSDGLLIPHARSFASVVNSISKVYSFRWDEALRDAPQNALAMRRDVYLRSLLQERIAPTVSRRWQLAVDRPADPHQALVRDGLTRAILAIRRFKQLKANLLEAIWYGRYGVQGKWERQTDAGGLWTLAMHKPVNGDKIQYQWDDTPVVLINASIATQFSSRDPSAVISTDRGGWALRLYRPEWRDRFLIHIHSADDADYFEGEMAGGVHGVGLRSLVYWGNWLRTETLTWMLAFMQSVGMMDLMIFNYADGNKAAREAAEANARKISGKLSLAVPRDPREKFPAVELLSTNTAGVEALRKLVAEYFDRHIERLFVGQSMSSGSDAEGSLGGSGRANFARDTKQQLLNWDADNLDETLTSDLVAPAKRFNYPWADFPVRFESVVEPVDPAGKVASGVQLVAAGVSVKASELREAAGFTEPDAEDGDRMMRA